MTREQAQEQAQAWRKVRKWSNEAVHRIQGHRITVGELVDLLEKIKAEAEANEAKAVAGLQQGLGL